MTKSCQQAPSYLNKYQHLFYAVKDGTSFYWMACGNAWSAKKIGFVVCYIRHKMDVLDILSLVGLSLYMAKWLVWLVYSIIQHSLWLKKVLG